VSFEDCRVGHTGASAVAVADAVAHCMSGSGSSPSWAEVVAVDRDLRSS
jgi:hypothetical protein